MKINSKSNDIYFNFDFNSNSIYYLRLLDNNTYNFSKLIADASKFERFF